MNQKFARLVGASALALAFGVPCAFHSHAIAAVIQPAGALRFGKPPAGTPINIKWGQIFKVLIYGVGGCDMDIAVVRSNMGIISVDPPSATGVKSQTFELLGTKGGTTMLTFNTGMGTCPPASIAYPVTVSPDPVGMQKAFAFEWKNQLKGLKFDLKADYTDWSTLAKAKYTDILDGTVGYDQGISDLRDITNTSVWQMHMHTQGRLDDFADYGTTLLEQNTIGIGQGPFGFFPGDCGTWDSAEDSYRSEFRKSLGSIEKTSKGFLAGFVKKGFPPISAPAFCMPTIYSAGPTYATQTNRPAVLHYPEFTLVYAAPTTNAGANNGRISLSGYTDSSFGPNIDLKITRVVNGNPDEVTTFSAPVNGWGFSHEFTGLPPGRYSYEGRYGTDIIAIGGITHIGKL
jgi:hypothetical protein